MLVICTLVVVVLLVFVVPKIVDIFIKQKIALPVPTRIMLGISNGIVNWWWLIAAGIFGAISLLRWYYRQPQGRQVIDRFILSVPIYGPIFVKVNTARVMRTLGTLLSSGVGLLGALEITRNLVSNVHLVKTLEDAREGVQEGRSLAKEFSKSGLFPPMVGHMIAIGEKSGELESMLGKVGKIYESEVNAVLGGITRIIEPLMMVGVGIVVFSIVMSVLMPMTELINMVQQ
jgi:general secretion pathway protein F